MRSVDDGVEEIQSAIAQLRDAAMREDDFHRLQTAEQLAQRFTGISDSEEMRTAVREALLLYRGGMGSFQDTGTSAVATAVDRLSVALREAI